MGPGESGGSTDRAPSAGGSTLQGLCQPCSCARGPYGIPSSPCLVRGLTLIFGHKVLRAPFHFPITAVDPLNCQYESSLGLAYWGSPGWTLNQVKPRARHPGSLRDCWASHLDSLSPTFSSFCLSAKWGKSHLKSEDCWSPRQEHYQALSLGKAAQSSPKPLNLSLPVWTLLMEGERSRGPSLRPPPTEGQDLGCLRVGEGQPSERLQSLKIKRKPSLPPPHLLGSESQVGLQG